MAVCDDSELVIDGFTRSACVYATVAFQQAQPRPVRVAHLLHSPGHIIEAVRRGVPAVVTIREPEGAVLSCLIREPFTSPGQVLSAWTRFYRALLPYRDRLVAAEFSRVTSDMGGIVREVNERFGTGFAPVQDGPEATNRAFAFIEERARRPAWDSSIGLYMSGLIDEPALEAARRAATGPSERAAGVAFEDRVARPSPQRQAQADRLRAAYGAERLATARREAERVFGVFLPT
jgi:hypothetical protein